MKIWLRLVYAGGDVAETLLQPWRRSYTFVALLYPFYIKSEVLIYFQLNVNDRRAQVPMLQLAIMSHRHITCMLVTGGSGKMESEGQKVLGASMIVRRQMATLWEL